MANGKPGRPRKFGTPADLKKAVDAYFKKCEEEGEFPAEPGMLIFLGIGRTAYDAYCGRTDTSEVENLPKFSDADKFGYKAVFEEAALKREDWLAKKMAADGKGANGYMNLLKQKANGSYKDRPADDESKAITINLIGVGGEGNFK